MQLINQAGTNEEEKTKINPCISHIAKFKNQSIKQWSEQSVKRKKLKDIQLCSYILIHRQSGRVHRKMGSYYLLRRRPDSRDRKGKITFHQISFVTF